MTTSPTVPSSFEPFDDLVVCSNRLLNGTAPFQLSGDYPLLIGKGASPRVWLKVPDPSGHYVTLVDDSRAQHAAIQVTIEGLSVVVAAGDVTVLSVTKRLDDLAVIEHLDLRPVGLDIHGSEVGLHVAGMELTGNHMDGAQVMVGLG